MDHGYLPVCMLIKTKAMFFFKTDNRREHLDIQCDCTHLETINTFRMFWHGTMHKFRGGGS